MKVLSRPIAAALLATTLLASSPSLSPALADSFTVTDVLVGQSGVSFTIPTIEVVDGNMSEADIRSVLKGDDLASASKALAGWDAASIRIPEMRYSQIVKAPDSPDVTVEIVYRNLTIEGMKGGVATSSRVDGADITIRDAQPVTGSIGAFTTGLVDFGALTGLYAGGGGEMKTIYKDVAFEGAKITGPEGFACDIGKFATAEFKARPMQMSFVELMTLTESMGNGAAASPAEMQKLVGFYGDLFQGMESSPTTFDGLSCRFPDEQGRPVNFSIGRIEAEGFGKGRYPAITLNNLDVSVVGDGFVKAGKLMFKGMDLNGVLEAVQGAGDQLSEAWFEQNYRKLIPAFDGLAIENVSIDVPDESNPGQRIKGTIGAFDLTLKAYQLGIPTDISITSDNVAIELPTDGSDPELAQIRALGYDKIDLSAATKLRWDEASNTIVIDEVSTTGTDMGSVSLSAIIGNAGKDLFAEDPGTMQGAAMGLSVKELSISAEDDGLSEKLFTFFGEQQGQDAEAMRTQVSGMAGGMIPMFLGGTEQAQEVANAVMTFLNGGTSLTVTAVAKDAAGLGFMDFMAAQDNPLALVEKVDLSAEAE